MQSSLYDLTARRKTVSITMNADLAAKAAAAGLNLSRTAEEAIAQALAERERERIAADLREASRMVDEYVAIHGMPFDDWATATDPAAPDTDHAA